MSDDKIVVELSRDEITTIIQGLRLRMMELQRRPRDAESRKDLDSLLNFLGSTINYTVRFTPELLKRSEGHNALNYMVSQANTK
jgi:hypothetical protein